ncbi:glycosyltransferase, partial [Saccharolobus sp.]|uniref:glycosyltransferase n=1 Tax=Saccharolobus sp. TaxID=2100761 RepID=UPI00318240B5
HVLLKALALLKRKGVKFTALLIGKTGPKTYRQYLERMIETLNLKKYIKMLGFINSTDLLYVYNAADVTVVPSYSEGGPLVTPESLSCETSVIATDVGGNAEYLGLIGLNNLLLKIKFYDFSNSFLEKICEVFGEIKRIRTKILSNRDNILSWEQVAKK